jgi:hypothetical protein
MLTQPSASKRFPFDYVYSTPRIDSEQYLKTDYLFGAETTSGIFKLLYRRRKTAFWWLLAFPSDDFGITIYISNFCPLGGD